LPWNSAPSLSAIKHHSPPNKPSLFQLKKTALGELRKADRFPGVDYPVVGLFEVLGALSDISSPQPALCNTEKLGFCGKLLLVQALLLTVQARLQAELVL